MLKKKFFEILLLNVGNCYPIIIDCDLIIV